MKMKEFHSLAIKCDKPEDGADPLSGESYEITPNISATSVEITFEGEYLFSSCTAKAVCMVRELDLYARLTVECDEIDEKRSGVFRIQGSGTNWLPEGAVKVTLDGKRCAWGHGGNLSISVNGNGPITGTIKIDIVDFGDDEMVTVADLEALEKA